MLSSIFWSLEDRADEGDFLENLSEMITEEIFSGDREEWWSDADPAEVEWEEEVWF